MVLSIVFIDFIDPENIFLTAAFNRTITLKLNFNV
jgi:hypothetical protein